MSNYLEKLPDEIIDYIYLIRFRDDFKKALNEINYKYLVSNDKDTLKDYYKYNENCWWKKFHHLNPNEKPIKITYNIEKKKGWLADAVKEKLNITMFKKWRVHLDDYECLENRYSNKYSNKYNLNFKDSSVLVMVNGTWGYSNVLNKRHKYYTKDHFKLMLRNNGYLNSSIPLDEQLSNEELLRYFAKDKNTFYYKPYYNSWTRVRLIKEIMKL